MDDRQAVRIAALFGLLAVGLGAFGAHGLESRLELHGAVDTWETAVFYHFMHALVLLWLAGRPSLHAGPYLCLAAGILIFSGSLYLLAITNLRWLGAVTPIGGLAFIAGWAWLLIAPAAGAGGRPTASGS